jgi:hypothetical protein
MTTASAGTDWRAWAEQRLAGEGVLAVGGGASAADVFVAHVAPEFVLALNKEIWRTVGQTLERLQEVNAPSDLGLWTFEESLLWTARRPDGAWLAVFTVPRPSDEIAALIDSGLTEFRGSS